MLKWWGYRHTNGSLQAKRFFGFQDICEAEDSPFVDRTAGPFEAKDRQDAINKLKEALCLH